MRLKQGINLGSLGATMGGLRGAMCDSLIGPPSLVPLAGRAAGSGPWALSGNGFHNGTDRGDD
ncbi:hypothetical protein KHP60_16635 [Microvirga sp. 3-52]|uniref:hypothetical protein n=1 Tax=Microvirga sp. 3-52 TaxID=2792425 RepID=UPI001ACF998B|nr:hypothetical protein [Microvirga sp. 3-52]MBO1906844.1 hypothetical protein [Microvirga sp. 3-52]MBS7453959.1 hypothetical protein [Microvirga sp. 3-52]